MTNLLSDGSSVKVRRLRFLELEDEVPHPDPGPYIHVYEIEGGHPQPVAYTLEDYYVIPERPDRPYSDATIGDELYEQWLQYRLYRAVLTHERKRVDIREAYLEDCARYILRTCMSSEDRLRILTADDYKIVYHLALCPEVTEGDIMAVLAETFRGYLEGQAFMDLSEEAYRVGWLLYSDTSLGTAINAATLV